MYDILQSEPAPSFTLSHEQQPVLRAIGLMSGTSLDGIDVGYLETDGRIITQIGATATYPYRDDERAILREALARAVHFDQTQQSHAHQPHDYDQMNVLFHEAATLITRTHTQAVKHFMAQNGLTAGDVDVIGFHGQTVLHRPEKRLTIQLGDGAALARDTGIRVVNDFRKADVLAGGQGAPLVPVMHQALVRSHKEMTSPCAVLNIGGVSNITLLDKHDPIACDVGPGNALLDDFMFARLGVAMDRDGQAAAKGIIHQARIDTWLSHPFFNQSWPKSLDRNDFQHVDVADLNIEDGAATLTSFTAQAVVRIIPHLPVIPKQWMVCGGGAYNPTLLRFLERAVQCPVMVTNHYGWPADGVEALAFAFLAVRSLYNLPITFPNTTGVERPLTGGVVHNLA